MLMLNEGSNYAVRSKMKFCPKWVFEAACGAAAADFLSNKVDLDTVGNSYAAALADFYSPISPREFVEFISSVLRFLDELDAGEAAAPMLIGFTHNRVFFEAPNKPRKLKGLFGSAEEPAKDCEYSAVAAVKSFKAYIYSLRNNIVEMAPSGWSLSDVDESPVLERLAKRSLSPLDFL